MNLQDNQYWFPAKRYGWGWGPPIRWQGWVVFVLFLAVVITDAILFAGRRWLLYALIITLAVAAVIAVCWWKGEPPRWRWGD